MRRRLPAMVWIAVAALGIVLVLQIALALSLARAGAVGWWKLAFAVLLFGAVVVGLVRGLRLAWLWGRFLTIVLGVIMAASIAAGIARHALSPLFIAVSIGGLVLPLLAAGIALGHPSSYAFYDLVCPTCGKRTGFGSDFLFRKARCRSCGTVW